MTVTLRTVRLPLSDAETTFMPELYPATVPVRVALLCNWCSIKLSAIPDAPTDEAGYMYHPSCLQARRAQYTAVAARWNETFEGRSPV